MAKILNDAEIKQLIGNVIIDGDECNIRPNSYIIRLGSSGEFLNTEKRYELGADKKGIKILPGQSVAVTAFETIDFRRKTIHKIYPDNDLHGIISPTTDLSREGIVAPTTQIDAGYYGTLNWTLTNTSNMERRFIYKEKLFRLTFYKLEKGEIPESLYDGDYQNIKGYVRSKRKGAPIGMKESGWESSAYIDNPETLSQLGYPWNLINKRLVKLETPNINSNWLIWFNAILTIILGALLTFSNNQLVIELINRKGTWIGIGSVLFGIVLLSYLITKWKPS